MRGPNPREYVSTRIPSRRASTRWPASWAAMSSPRPTMVKAMESTARQCTRCIHRAQDLRSAAYANCPRNDGSDLSPLAGPGPVEVVAQDLGVIEAELFPGDLGFGVPARILRVVRGLERAAAHFAGVDGGDGVLARIPLGVGVGEQLLDQLDLEPRLFPRLPLAGAAQLLAMVDEPAGQGPAPRFVLAQDEDHPAVGAGDHRVGGGQRVLAPGHQGVISPLGVAGGMGDSAGFCQRPSRARLNSARAKAFLGPCSPGRSRETARAVRAASRRPSEASTWAISRRRRAYRARRWGVKYASAASSAARSNAALRWASSMNSRLTEISSTFRAKERSASSSGIQVMNSGSANRALLPPAGGGARRRGRTRSWKRDPPRAPAARAPGSGARRRTRAAARIRCGRPPRRPGRSASAHGPW